MRRFVVLPLLALMLAGCATERAESSLADPTPAESYAPFAPELPVAPEPVPAPVEPSPQEPAPVAPGEASPGTVAASIGDGAYEPALVTVSPGTSVVWTNEGARTHSVVSDDGGFSGSGLLDPTQAFTFTFQVPGEYRYHCRYHPELTGTVVVR